MWSDLVRDIIRYLKHENIYIAWYQRKNCFIFQTKEKEEILKVCQNTRIAVEGISIKKANKKKNESFCFC